MYKKGTKKCNFEAYISSIEIENVFFKPKYVYDEIVMGSGFNMPKQGSA